MRTRRIITGWPTYKGGGYRGVSVSREPWQSGDDHPASPWPETNPRPTRRKVTPPRMTAREKVELFRRAVMEVMVDA